MFNRQGCLQDLSNGGKAYRSLRLWWLQFVRRFTWFVFLLDTTRLWKYVSCPQLLFQSFKVCNDFLNFIITACDIICMIGYINFLCCLFVCAVYRVFTSIFFHGSILHLVFNMLALVPLGSELERVMGSIRLLYMIVLLATSSAIFHLLITLIAAYNPVYSYYYFMDECAIGFSGVLFSMIVIETGLSGVQSRRLVSSIFD